jgi:methyl-accepting chemotaxis protein
MDLTWTFGRKLGAGFALAALTLLLVAVFGYQSTHRLIENDRWVSHTQQVRFRLADLVSLMKDAETGQRGYVITANDQFLEPYQAALPQIDTAFNDLRTLTSDNPDQQRRLDAARPLIDAKLGELKFTIDQRKNDGFDATEKTVAEGRGKRSMDQLRGVLAEMDREEQGLLERRRLDAESSAETTKAVILWGSVIGLIFIVGVGTWISQSLTTQVSGAVRHIQSSSAELQAASNQQATGAKEQATAMNEIATTINELLATSRQIAESAQSVARVAERTAAAARVGDATIGKGQESIAGIRRQVDLIVSHMLELGKKSQQIGSVLEIVSELAEQTNILAINATIEAAGAGDAGKRFAVVADEIRKLADRVAGSAKEVRGLIDDVRSAVNTTVMTTETGSKAVEAGSKQIGEVTLAFKEISAQVTTTTEAAKEIELSTKQQSTAVEQVNVAITNVAQASKESEVSTGQTLQTASQLSSLSRDLLKIVQPQAQTQSQHVAG